MVWKPHVTVAAVIEKERRFLLVEERIAGEHLFNQPAGHLEEGEDLINAVRREVREETAWQFDPEHVISIQLWRKNPDAASFLRVCFAGTVKDHNPALKLDDGIIKTHWLSRDEVAEKREALRSPLVLQSIDDYLAGQFYPLSLLKSSLNSNHE